MKWKLLPIIALLGLLFLIPKSSSIESSGCYLSINADQSLGIGTYGNYTVLVEVTSGSINSTFISLDVFDISGEFRFNSNATGTLHFSDPATDYDLQASGGTITVDEATGHIDDTFAAGDLIVLTWSIPVTPILPFGFILGMVGLGSMFGGTLWMIKKLKDHDWNEAITEGFVIALLGIALFMAWLAMA